ncbi:MAG: SDR family NAD(P)-dependent oxidoreductase [Rhodospirillaceae bacterium]|nr:SDR family NAD(P)-dependent oxidoreductase [Rhodospirillaceae bacterium]
MSEAPHILVTGGAGFIGSHTVDALMAKGFRVSVLDNLSTGYMVNLEQWDNHPRFNFVDADITQDLTAAFAKMVARFGPIERIAHFAAQTAVPISMDDPVGDIQANLAGTARILEYARHNNVAKLFFASSSAVYDDDAPVPVSEESRARPMSPYGIDKLAVEFYLDYYAKLYGLTYTALRFMNVYGPRQDPKSWYSGVISIFLDRAATGQSITIFDDGDQTRDFVYVTDVAQAVVHALLTNAGDNAIINIGTGVEVTINVLTKTILDLAGSASPVRYEPARPGDIRRSVTTMDKAVALLQFNPRVELREGLHATLAWVREEKNQAVARTGSGSAA